MDEDAILRAQHPLYQAFCREDEVEYDPYEGAEQRWEMEDER